MRRSTLTLMLMLSTVTIATAQELNYHAEPLAFAEHLIDQGKLEDARFVLSTAPLNDTEKLKANHIKATTFYIEGQLDSALWYEQLSYDASFPSTLVNQIYLHQGKQIDAPTSSAHAKYEILLLQHMAFLAQEGQLDSFKLLMERHTFSTEELANAEFTLFLKAASEAYYKPKKPWIGGVFSTVIPGSGRIYAGKWREGITSLVPILIFSAQAAEGFYFLGFASPHFYAFAPLALVFYGANIAGSIRAVRRENYSHTQKLHHEVLDLLDPLVLQQ